MKIFGSKDKVTGDCGGDAYFGASKSSRFTKYFTVDQIKKNEMVRACDTFRAQKRCIQNFGAET